MDASLKKNINQILKISINEDKINSDITGKLLLSSKTISSEIKFKQGGIICGSNIIDYILNNINKRIKSKWFFKEGAWVKKDTVVGVITGPEKIIIKLERILLNFLQRTSGIATLTSLFNKHLKATKVKLLDTRKTTPGWRTIEKYAVRVGGGTNHRLNLNDAYLVKDNHIKICGGLKKTLNIIAVKNKIELVEVEVKNISEVKMVSKFNVKRIMLDNFKLNNIKKSIEIIRKNPNIEIEVSGGVNLKKIKFISKLDIDFVSIGALTHSSPSLDISLNVLK